MMIIAAMGKERAEVTHDTLAMDARGVYPLKKKLMADRYGILIQEV